MITILQGDAIEQLKTLPDESVHCCVTSPPYFGLRDYSICGCTNPKKAPDPSCLLCHGTGIIETVKKHQIGLEETIEEYVKKLVDVFREVRRVLRKDGTLWLNVSDGYVNTKATQSPRRGRDNLITKTYGAIFNHTINIKNLKPKDLIGIPWRLAFALQEDGWWLRTEIIWSKPNPMPESVTDRPTRSHEYIFLLTKSQKYFFDQEAIREKPEKKRKDDVISEHNARTVWEIVTQPYPDIHSAVFPEEVPRRCIKAGTSEKGCCPKCGAPWERIVEVSKFDDRTGKPFNIPSEKNSLFSQSEKRTINIRYHPIFRTKTVGWQPTCSCGINETFPCVVLDPFAGSGTTGMVARSLGRKSILIELNPVYVKFIEKRTKSDVPDIFEILDKTANGE